MIHISRFGVNAPQKGKKTGFGKGVTTSCHGIIKAAEITAAAHGDKVAAAVAAHGDKAAVAVASLHRILTRLFVRGVMRGGG
jgi:hypothetical protein